MTTSQPDSAVARCVQQLAAGRSPGETLTREAFAQVMRGEASGVQMAALLTGLRVLGAGVDEITGAARALRDAMVTVPVRSQDQLIDTCGTGGGTVGTFNISTAAALVAAGAGARVAKHGNRSFTSRSGSADLMEALGVEITLDADRAAALLDRVRMAFLFAPVFHPAMRHVAPVRRELAIPTIMNVVGPLANPAGVTRQLLGVADRDLAAHMAEVLNRLGARHALVVNARVGMDELAPKGATDAWEVREGEVMRLTIEALEFGLEIDDLAALAGGGPEDNAARVEQLLAEPRRDPAGRAAVALNAGAACYVAGLAGSFAEGVELALATLDEGRAAEALERLRHATRSNTSG